MTIDLHEFNQIANGGVDVYDHEGDFLDVQASRKHCNYLLAHGAAVVVTIDYSITTAIQLVGPGITNPVPFTVWD